MDTAINMNVANSRNLSLVSM